MQSKDYNKGLFEMYKKEHDDFCKNLMCKDHLHIETNKAWHKLNEIMK